MILSAITAGGFLATIFGGGEIGAFVGVIVSTCLLVLTAYTKNYDLGELAQKHKQAANDLWLIRERYFSILTDLASESKSIASIEESRDKLLKELHSIYSGAPSTNLSAYRKAQLALKGLEDMTFSDKEIDAFLPKELKRD